jgi:hypothetical protein
MRDNYGDRRGKSTPTFVEETQRRQRLTSRLRDKSGGVKYARCAKAQARCTAPGPSSPQDCRRAATACKKPSLLGDRKQPRGLLGSIGLIRQGLNHGSASRAQYAGAREALVAMYPKADSLCSH